MDQAAQGGEQSNAEVLRSIGVQDPHRPRFSMEVVGEIVLLAVVGAFFVYLLFSSLDWPLGAALTPRIAVALGTPFLIYRIVFLLRRTTVTPSQIMDMGFRVGTDPQAERARLMRITFYVAGLYLAIWIFGFHIALPAGMFFYLLVYGRAGWFWSLVIGFVFLGVLILIYDNFLRMHWHQPLLFQLLDIRYQGIRGIPWF